jgi:hypothetical protein
VINVWFGTNGVVRLPPGEEEGRPGVMAPAASTAFSRA